MNNIKEITKRNVFIKNAKLIKDICTEKEVDIGVAANIWATDNGIIISEVKEQYREYQKLCGEYTLNTIVDMID